MHTMVKHRLSLKQRFLIRRDIITTRLWRIFFKLLTGKDPYGNTSNKEIRQTIRKRHDPNYEKPQHTHRLYVDEATQQKLKELFPGPPCPKCGFDTSKAETEGHYYCRVCLRLYDREGVLVYDGDKPVV